MPAPFIDRHPWVGRWFPLGDFKGLPRPTDSLLSLPDSFMPAEHWLTELAGLEFVDVRSAHGAYLSNSLSAVETM